MKPRIEGLTATRGIVALLIVSYHFGRFVPPFKLLWDYLGYAGFLVSYFFVLSGFVMAWSQDEAPVTPVKFWLHRIGRVMPLYWALLLCFLVQELYRNQVLHLASRSFFWRDWWVDFFFLQAWYTPAIDALNAPAWSLGPEIFFYLIFPLVGWFYRKRPVLFIGSTAFLFVFTQAIHFYINAHLPGKWWYDLNYTNPLLRLNEFMIGMVFARYALQWKAAKVRLPTLTIFVLLVIMIVALQTHIRLQFGLLAPVFGLLIAGISLQEPTLLKWKPLIIAGTASYGIYLFQGPLFQLMMKLNRAPNLPYAWLFYGSIALLAFAGWLSFYCFELPVLKWIRKQVKP